jgi:spore germination cell wall hydrolase CwlJ-like protein
MIQLLAAVLAAAAIYASFIHTDQQLTQVIQQNSEITARLDRLEEIVDTHRRINYTAADLHCLTSNIYWEAGVEDVTGKYAVATVTLNRLATGRWGASVCAVVHAPGQFSWTRIKNLEKPRPDLWKKCETIAWNSLNGQAIRGLQASLWYHADYIEVPDWAAAARPVLQLGRHVFYNRISS